MLRTVAVMDVPVEDQDALDTVAPKRMRGDRDVVEETESHRAPRFCVVARRANRGECGVDSALRDCTGRVDRGAGREERDVVALLRDVGIRVEARGRHARGRGDPAQMRGGMDRDEFLLIGASRRDLREPIATLGDGASHGHESSGSLGMRIRRTVRGEARILDDRDAAGGVHRRPWYLTGGCVAGSRGAGKERS